MSPKLREVDSSCTVLYNWVAWNYGGIFFFFFFCTAAVLII